jgi:hypothetical protein
VYNAGPEGEGLPAPPFLLNVTAADPALNVPAGSRTVTLSNTQLPVDQFNRSLITGEADILEHPTDKSYYVYFNNWGECPGVDCCGSTVGCRDCCYFERVPPTCVTTSNHSVVVYRTVDFVKWQYLGEALPAAARPAPRKIEYRPHVVFNAKTDLFVLWYNVYDPDSTPEFRYGVATSKTAEGPFTVMNISVVTYANVKLGDFDILTDGDRAFLVHGDTQMAVEELDADFTGMTGRFSLFTIPKDPHGRGSEGFVFFKRDGVFYVLPGSGCCACRGGSNIYVFTAIDPLGPYNYRGDVGTNTTHPFDQHSPWNYPTRAQASAVVQVGSQFLWMGNQWTTSRALGHQRNHDLLYWWPLEFTTDGNLTQVRWEASVELRVPTTASLFHLTPRLAQLPTDSST